MSAKYTLMMAAVETIARAGRIMIERRMAIGKKQNVRNAMKARRLRVDGRAIEALLGGDHVSVVRHVVSGRLVKEVVIATLRSLTVGNVVGLGSVAGVAVVKRSIGAIGMSEMNVVAIGINETAAITKNGLKNHVIGHVSDIAIDVAVVVIAEVGDEHNLQGVSSF